MDFQTDRRSRDRHGARPKRPLQANPARFEVAYARIVDKLLPSRMSRPMSKSSRQPKRQHFVSRFYLRRFSANDRLVMVDRASLVATPITVSNAAVVKDFYTLRAGDGSDSYQVESWLGQRETAAAPAIERLVRGKFPPCPEDREQLAMFIALQHLKGPNFRDAQEDIGPALVRHITATTTVDHVRAGIRRSAGREPTDAEVQQAYWDLRANLTADYGRVPDRAVSIRSMISLALSIIPYLLARTWLLVKFSDPVLLTSDRPVTLWRPPGPLDLLGGGVGILTSHEIRFPIDPRHLLMLATRDYGPERVVQSLPGDERELNFWTAAEAYKWIYHSPNQRPLDGLELPPPYGLPQFRMP